MSRSNNHYTYSRPAATSRTRLPTPRDIKLEISRLDASLSHLIDDILPRVPYLISVPSDVPYRHNSRFVNSWNLGTPFAKEEEPLQYMSFLTHQDPEQSLTKAVGGWSDEKGNLVDEDPSPQQIYGSTSNSLFSAGQGKKISLTDYKSKARVGAASNKPGVMGQFDPQQPRSKDPELNGQSKTEAKNGEVEANGPVKKSPERKRSFEETADSSSKLKSPKPEKRPRMTSPVRAKSPNSPAKDQHGTNVNKSRVPLLLSPTLPPADYITSIPKLLSPTLPSSIEELLAQDDDEREQKVTTTYSKNDSVRSIFGAAGTGSSPLSASKKAGIARTDHERHLSPSLQIDLKESRISPGARGRASTSSPGPRQRHVIVLKYGKRNKKRVEGLLKFAPRSKKQIPRTEVLTEDKHGLARSVNGVTNSSHEAASRREKEGPTSHPSEPPQRRPKIAASPLAVSERPTTPIPSAFKSPSVQNPLQPRSAFSTPKKDLKTTAMRRVESTDGLDARTPTANMTRQSTPGASPSDMNSIPSQRDDVRRAWKAVNVKYYELGRRIKHEGQSLLQQEKPDEKQAVLLHIEALLCFMLNQTAQSYSNDGSDPGWRNILPYLIFVHRISMPFAHLHGLVGQLGAVCRQTIAKNDLERLGKEPLPEEHTQGSAPTPGSDGNTKSSHNEDPDKARRRWNTFRTELTDNAKELQRAWLDGYQKLNPDILKQDFPDTWTKRARDPSLKSGGGLERLSPENLAGKYFLPLDANTMPVEAVRYAKGVLVEWADREVKRGWRSRIDI